MRPLQRDRRRLALVHRDAAADLSSVLVDRLVRFMWIVIVSSLSTVSVRWPWIVIVSLLSTVSVRSCLTCVVSSWSIVFVRSCPTQCVSSFSTSMSWFFSAWMKSCSEPFLSSNRISLKLAGAAALASCAS